MRRVRRMIVSDLTGLFLGLSPFLALLLWCEVRDRRRDRADVVRADTHDRIVSDTDREMARISADVGEYLAALARELDDVPVESMVRFGRLGTELSIEAEVFGADLIAMSGKPRPGLRDRLRAWY